MRKKIALFAMFAALSSWSFARAWNTLPQDKQDKDDKSTSAQSQNDNDIDVVGAPSVNASTDHAVIRWRTDKVSASMIKYGTDQNNLSQEQQVAGGARDHDVTLTGLQPGTKYFYAITARNGQVRKTGDFTTQGSASAGMSTSGSTSASASGTDSVQIIDGPRPTNLTATSATLVWKTDKTAASDVRYGLDPNNLDQRAYERGGERDHDAELSNLQPGKTYYFQILRRNGTIRQSGQFTTPTSSAATMPSTGTSGQGNTATVAVNKGPVPQYVNQNTAVISWTTDKQSSSTVKYGTDPNNLSQTATGNWGTNHQVTVQGLQPSTTYYYQAQSSPAEGTGNVASSSTQNFQTVAPGQQAKQQARPF